jgi:hypothetical protein
MSPLLPAHLVLIDALAEMAVDEYLADLSDTGQEAVKPTVEFPDLDQAA